MLHDYKQFGMDDHKLLQELNLTVWCSKRSAPIVHSYKNL